MNYHLMSQIVKGIWAIDQESALGYAPLLMNIFGESEISFEFDKNNFQAQSYERGTTNYSSYDGWNNAPENSIAIIPISGPLMKSDQFCGPVGMASIGNMIREADASKNIAGIILKIDSPGGTVDGTVQLAEIVKNTQKPVIAFVDGLAASAALWIGSQADEIIAATNKTQIGSIGVMFSFADLQPAYELMGVKFHTINADQSKDKNRIFEDIRKGNYDEYKKTVLNPLAADFINAIKASRPGVNDDQLTGKVYFAQDVIGSLVDKVGHWDFALTQMNALIEMKTTTIVKQTNKTKATMKKQFAKVNALLGVDALESNDEAGAFLNEEQLEKMENALTDKEKAESDLAAANSAKQEAETAKTNAEADLATANQTIEQKDAEIAGLKKAPGATTATAAVSKDKIETGAKDGNITSESNSFAENMAAVGKEFL
jgi:signal peptide peptidase SppA